MRACSRRGGHLETPRALAHLDGGLRDEEGERRVVRLQDPVDRLTVRRRNPPRLPRVVRHVLLRLGLRLRCQLQLLEPLESLRLRRHLLRRRLLRQPPRLRLLLRAQTRRRELLRRRARLLRLAAHPCVLGGVAERRFVREAPLHLLRLALRAHALLRLPLRLGRPLRSLCLARLLRHGRLRLRLCGLRLTPCLRLPSLTLALHRLTVATRRRLRRARALLLLGGRRHRRLRLRLRAHTLLRLAPLAHPLESLALSARLALAAFFLTLVGVRVGLLLPRGFLALGCPLRLLACPQPRLCLRLRALRLLALPIEPLLPRGLLGRLLLAELALELLVERLGRCDRLLLQPRRHLAPRRRERRSGPLAAQLVRRWRDCAAALGKLRILFEWFTEVEPRHAQLETKRAVH